MQINLGVIGEQHTINRFNEIIPDYKEFIPHIYIDEKEELYPDIIRKNNNLIDVWLVFDQIFYNKIKFTIKNLNKPIYYIPYRGASLFKVLCSLIYKQNKVEEISMDTVPYFDLVRGLKEMDIDFSDVHCLKDDGSLKIIDYFKYHYDLFKSGKTKVAITRSYYLKKMLEESGIPAVNVIPLRVTIRAILNMILNEVRIKNLEATQIAVQIFSFEINAYKTPYLFDDIYSKKIAITQKLLKYSKKILGSLKTTVDGNYYIFTTRGILEKETNNFTSEVKFEELAEIHKNLIATGIGIGNSAREAEANALIALKHSINYERGSWFVVLNDKTISGPLGKSYQLNYSYNSEALADASLKTTLSITTLSKVKNALEKYGRNTISSQELAIAMQMLPRSARRILNCLTLNGYAEEIGEESPENKGRPRKIYKISL